MRPSENCLAVQCPHCQGEKNLMELLSGNTFRYTFWSDTKANYPMLPKNSPVQKCPHCGHYFMLTDAKIGRKPEYTNETGWLTCDEALEAFKEITPKNDKDWVTLAINTIWSYNDIYRNGNTPTPEQQASIKAVIDKMIERKSLFTQQLFIAELYRENGEFDKCLEVLSTFQAPDKQVEECAQKIKEKAEAHNSEIFILAQG